jgi:hypothetical protein
MLATIYVYSIGNRMVLFIVNNKLTIFVRLIRRGPVVRSLCQLPTKVVEAPLFLGFGTIMVQ